MARRSNWKLWSGPGTISAFQIQVAVPLENIQIHICLGCPLLISLETLDKRSLVPPIFPLNPICAPVTFRKLDRVCRRPFSLKVLSSHVLLNSTML